MRRPPLVYLSLPFVATISLGCAEDYCVTFEDQCSSTSTGTESPETETESPDTGTGDPTTSSETQGDCPAGTLGCPCLDDECDEGLACDPNAQLCVESVCGNGVIEPDEVCDDGNDQQSDGCDNDCTATTIVDVALGGGHGCVLFDAGDLRCWGRNAEGQLGDGTTNDYGDEPQEELRTRPFVPLLDHQVVAVAAGDRTTCAVLDDSAVVCWGANDRGLLGRGHGETIGDDEVPLSDLDPAALTGVVHISLSPTPEGHACAVRDGGVVSCWGRGDEGQLGLNTSEDLGVLAALPPDLAALLGDFTAVRAWAAGTTSCALSTGGAVACWGNASNGLLGVPGAANIGKLPGSLPDELAPISFFSTVEVEDIGLGYGHGCVLTAAANVACWGYNLLGLLGRDEDGLDNEGLGDDEELLGAVKNVALPDPVSDLAVGPYHSCALTDADEVYCWGDPPFGALGNASVNDTIGDGVGASPGDTPVRLPPQPSPTRMIRAGSYWTCVYTESSEGFCWGRNDDGALGYGHTLHIGDDEFPDETELAGFYSLI